MMSLAVFFPMDSSLVNDIVIHPGRCFTLAKSKLLLMSAFMHSLVLRIIYTKSYLFHFSANHFRIVDLKKKKLPNQLKTGWTTPTHFHKGNLEAYNNAVFEARVPLWSRVFLFRVFSCKPYCICPILLQCTKSCGSGYRRRTLQCVDSHQQEVHEMYCVNQIRPPDIESCNVHACEFIWITGEWTQVRSKDAFNFEKQVKSD